MESFEVDYCTLGKAVKKRTQIWTNAKFLKEVLAGDTYQCKCRKEHKHQEIRGGGCAKAAVVPEELAALVAQTVKAQLDSEHVGWTALNGLQK